MLIDAGVALWSRRGVIGQLCLSESHGFSCDVDRVGIVDLPVEYGVGEYWIADPVVPMVDGQLAGGDSGAAKHFKCVLFPANGGPEA